MTSDISIVKKWLGLSPYQESFEIQKKCLEEVQQTPKIFLLGQEHPTVITLGRRGKIEKDVFSAGAISIVETERGGQATLHSPGQLVIYPIVPLQHINWAVKDFVRELEEITIETMREFGVDGVARQCSPGLYTSRGKIAFLGLKIEKGVSYHGLSVNISNDLNLFDAIRSCGVDQNELDQVSRYADLSAHDFFEAWVRQFRKRCEKPGRE